MRVISSCRYVVKNGPAFAANVQATRRGDPRFTFLEPENQFNRYFREEVARCSTATVSDVSAVTQSASAPISCAPQITATVASPPRSPTPAASASRWGVQPGQLISKSNDGKKKNRPLVNIVRAVVSDVPGPRSLADDPASAVSAAKQQQRRERAEAFVKKLKGEDDVPRPSDSTASSAVDKGVDHLDDDQPRAAAKSTSTARAERRSPVSDGSPHDRSKRRGRESSARAERRSPASDGSPHDRSKRRGRESSARARRRSPASDGSPHDRSKRRGGESSARARRRSPVSDGSPHDRSKPRAAATSAKRKSSIGDSEDDDSNPPKMKIIIKKRKKAIRREEPQRLSSGPTVPIGAPPRQTGNDTNVRPHCRPALTAPRFAATDLISPLIAGFDEEAT
jgi:hypothetical protein